MQKNNKLIMIVTSVVVVTGIIAGVLFASNNTPENNTNLTDSLDYVKEFEDGISISGDIENIYKVNIKEILEESKEFEKYNDTVSHIQSHYDFDVTKTILYEVKFLDANGNEITPSGAVTVYFKSENINTYEGSGFEILKITDGTGLYCTDSRIFTYRGETTIFFEIDKAETIMLMCYGEKREMPEIPPKQESTQNIEKFDMNISKDYKVPELSFSEIFQKYNTNSQVIANGINHVNKFDGMMLVVESVESLLNEDGTKNNENIIVTDAYYSQIYLNSKKDITKDGLTGKTLSFKDKFGFDYKDCNGIFDIYYKTLQTNGVSDFNYDDAKLDTFWYALTGEKKYVLNNTEKLIANFMIDTEYDKIVSSEAFYLMREDEFSNFQEKDYYFPKTLSIKVVYEKDDNTYSKYTEYYYIIYTEEILDTMLEGNYK